MYEFDTRVRYSETDSEGYLKIEALLDYYQDISTFHSEDLGLGVEYLSENHMIWLMSYWQIDVARYPKLGEKVRICTAPYEFKKFLGFRNFCLETMDGEVLSVANSVWTLMDTQKNMPVKPTEKMLAQYKLSPALKMEYLGRKIALPEDGKCEEKIVIKKHHLDTNYHVNNGQYVRMAADFLDKEMKIKRLRAEYKKSALLGDEIYPVIMRQDQRIVASLNNQDGQPYCIVEFTVE